jgi:hypothetical protein
VAVVVRLTCMVMSSRLVNWLQDSGRVPADRYSSSLFNCVYYALHSAWHVWGLPAALQDCMSARMTCL